MSLASRLFDSDTRLIRFDLHIKEATYHIGSYALRAKGVTFCGATGRFQGSLFFSSSSGGFLEQWDARICLKCLDVLVAEP